jgi:hypothetical protein
MRRIIRGLPPRGLQTRSTKTLKNPTSRTPYFSWIHEKKHDNFFTLYPSHPASQQYIINKAKAMVFNKRVTKYNRQIQDNKEQIQDTPKFQVAKKGLNDNIAAVTLIDAKGNLLEMCTAFSRANTKDDATYSKIQGFNWHAERAALAYCVCQLIRKITPPFNTQEIQEAFYGKAYDYILQKLNNLVVLDSIEGFGKIYTHNKEIDSEQELLIDALSKTKMLITSERNLCPLHQKHENIENLAGCETFFNILDDFLYKKNPGYKRSNKYVALSFPASGKEMKQDMEDAILLTFGESDGISYSQEFETKINTLAERYKLFEHPSEKPFMDGTAIGNSEETYWRARMLFESANPEYGILSNDEQYSPTNSHKQSSTPRKKL